MCCNSVIWLSEVCYNVSIADNVVYNKFQLADMLQWDYKKNPGNRPLEGYVDADWASDAEDRKSVAGFLFKVYGSTVSWASRKQSTVSLS